MSTGVVNVGQGTGFASGGMGPKGTIAKLGRNSALNLDKGSRACPIVSECRDVS